jgi:VIT1/CCC1 family predicted Fe2+/Mn2+ transporter
MPEEEARPARHGAATFAAFVAAGAMPLIPYLPAELNVSRFGASMILTLVALFGVGAGRSAVTVDTWWAAGLEMLLLGVVVAAAAYGSGAIVGALVGTVR